MVDLPFHLTCEMQATALKDNVNLAITLHRGELCTVSRGQAREEEKTRTA